MLREKTTERVIWRQWETEPVSLNYAMERWVRECLTVDQIRKRHGEEIAWEYLNHKYNLGR